MTTVAQAGLAADPEILRTAASYNTQLFALLTKRMPIVGAYATIVRGGTIRVGDEVRLEGRAPLRRVGAFDVSDSGRFAFNCNGALGTVGIDWVASPRAVEGISGVLEVASTPTMTCARTQGGEVWVWGGSADASAPAVPTRLDGIVGATGIFGDSRRCCASLGAGGFACVDTGTHIAEPRPTRSGDCGCTLDERAHLTCELHEMPTSPGMRPDNYVAPLHPCSVAGLDDVREFVTTNAGYAIRSDGQLWRWGPTTQWGNQRTEPAVMTALPKVRSIAAGMGGAVFAVDDAGAIWGWGSSSQDAITHDDGWVATPVRIWNPAAP